MHSIQLPALAAEHQADLLRVAERRRRAARTAPVRRVDRDPSTAAASRAIRHLGVALGTAWRRAAGARSDSAAACCA